jgi:succinate dehydrogenase / fumarate reductase flavoprotein subunit
VSIHGANRLGGNSLLDILVFGRAAGLHILDFLKRNLSHRPLDDAGLERATERLAQWDRSGEGETVDALRSDLKRIMETHCGVFRNAEVMQQGVEALQDLRARMARVRLRDTSRIFNTARIEALELENLMDIGMATMLSALAREESRGAHSRIDFPQRDDANWLKHTLYFREGDRIDFRPVRTRPLSVETFPPKPRVY